MLKTSKKAARNKMGTWRICAVSPRHNRATIGAHHAPCADLRLFFNYLEKQGPP
jgi:hypothetical protein